MFREVTLIEGLHRLCSERSKTTTAKTDALDKNKSVGEDSWRGGGVKKKNRS